MGPITLENVRASSDITVKVRLKDGGMYIAWTSLSDIKAYIFSDDQRAIAGRCVVSVDESDDTLLICDYAATKPQYLGSNSIVIRAAYDGRIKTYDRRAFNIVQRTSGVSGDVVLDDPIVDMELEVTDVSSSILDNVILAALAATDRAEAAAAEAEHMVDIHTGPAGIEDGTFPVACNASGDLSGTATVSNRALSMELNGVMPSNRAVFIGDVVETV